MEGHPTGERLRPLAQQLRRGAPEHEEPRRRGATVGQDAEHGEQVGAALHLVDHDEAGQVPQRDHRVAQAREDARILEVEGGHWHGELIAQCLREGRPADLARAEHPDDGELLQERDQASELGGPVDEVGHGAKLRGNLGVCIRDFVALWRPRRPLGGRHGAATAALLDDSCPSPVAVPPPTIAPSTGLSFAVADPTQRTDVDGRGGVGGCSRGLFRSAGLPPGASGRRPSDLESHGELRQSTVRRPEARP